MTDNTESDIEQYDLNDELTRVLSELRMKIPEALRLLDPDCLKEFFEGAVDEIITQDEPDLN